MSRSTARRQLVVGLIMSILAFGLVAGARAAVAGPGPLPFTVTNNSGRSEATHVYIIARNADTGQQGYVDGGGTWRSFSFPTDLPDGYANPAAPDVSIPGPANGSSKTLQLPNSLSGGRMYISFGAKMSFYLSKGGLVEPAPWNPADANADVLFDWAEFARINGAIFINTTQVDFFGVPMAVSVTGADGKSETQGAYKASRDSIFDAFRALGGDWAKLIQKRASDGLPLRVLAPTHGIKHNPVLFSATYLDPYINGVYDYYSSHDLTIDTASGVFVGRVSGGVLTFKNSGGSIVANLPKPTTDEVFGCSGAIQPTGQPDQRLALVLGAQMCAAFHRGTLSTPSRFLSDRHQVLDATKFYGAPQTDRYSKVIHDNMVNGKAYGFAYDDVADFSPSINQPNPVSATLTIAAFSGSGGGSTGDTGGGTGGSGGSTGGTGPTAGASGSIKSGITGKCLDVDGGRSTNGTVVQSWTCNDRDAQRWTAYSDGTLRAVGKCLDASGFGTTNGTKLLLWDCSGNVNQRWEAFNGGYRNPVSGRCIDIPKMSTADGVQVTLWDCSGNSNQKWSAPGGTVAGGSTGGSTGGSGGIAATSVIQAEAANAQQGTSTESTSDSGGGLNVGWVSNGDWLQFNNVNFGSSGLNTFSARVASGVAAGVSGTVEVRLDSLSNSPIGSFSVGNTGSWQTWRTVPAQISATTGAHTVFVKFVTGSGQDFLNVNWLTFS